ncbi:unnamed protein product [Blepharisma stoltei]|uniref:Uncharacterized protein n=1 Tax=Blepharisma stoltei TaxID=1481888 RepID=A0AAU9ITG6_9CILI|nr:unnamed protein product [Blepharisma stoltei]
MDVRCIIPVNTLQEINFQKYRLFKINLRNQLAANSSKRLKHRSIHTSVSFGEQTSFEKSEEKPPQKHVEIKTHNIEKRDSIDINGTSSQDTDRINLSQLLSKEYDLFTKEYEKPDRKKISPKYREIVEKITPVKYMRRKCAFNGSRLRGQNSPIDTNISIVGRPLSCALGKRNKNQKRPKSSLDFTPGLKKSKNENIGELSSKSFIGWECLGSRPGTCSPDIQIPFKISTDKSNRNASKDLFNFKPKSKRENHNSSYSFSQVAHNISKYGSSRKTLI